MSGISFRQAPSFLAIGFTIVVPQVQAQFAIRGITSQKTMFDYVIASLTPKFAAEICDLILTPPAETPYDVLKETLIKRTAASHQRHLQ